MKHSKLILVLALLLLAFSVTLVAVAQDVPSDPCASGVQIPEWRVKTGGDHFALFAGADKKGEKAIVVMHIDTENHGKCAIYLGPTDLAKIPDKPETNTLLAKYEDTALYKLTTGEFQINHGPDFEGKMIVVVFKGVPVDKTTLHTGDYIVPKPQ